MALSGKLRHYVANIIVLSYVYYVLLETHNFHLHIALEIENVFFSNGINFCYVYLVKIMAYSIRA